MSWLNIFRKKEENQKEKISFNEIEARIGKKRDEIFKAKEHLKNQLLKEVDNFELEIRKNIEELRLIDLSSRKEEEKIKVVVKENLRHYLDYLEKLILDLRKIETLEAEDYVTHVSEILRNFVKFSRAAYEKATILIGKLGDVKKKVNSLFNRIKQLREENQEVFNALNKINEINDSLGKLKELDKNKSAIDNNIKSLAKKIGLAEETIKNLDKNILDFKTSQEYFEARKEFEKKLMEKKEIENNLQKIKEESDLRFLAKKFHAERKKAEIAVKYAENFNKAVIEDENLEIIMLVKEASGKDISGLHELREKLLNISKNLTSEPETKLKNLENERKKIEYELSSEKKETNEEEKRKNKLEERKEELLNEIKAKAMEVLPEIEIDNACLK